MSTISSEYDSVLKLKSLICLKLHTKRSSVKNVDDKLDMEISQDIKLKKDEIVAKLGVRVFSEKNTFEAEVVMQGIFEVTNSVDSKLFESLTKRNTASIMFPYIRSQMTLITSQPGMSPIIIPVININAWFDDVDKDNEQRNISDNK